MVFRLVLSAVLCGILAGVASAQSDPFSTLLNRPPVAAPTSPIEVAPIEVVRSMAEVINDFGGGLIQGLMAKRTVRGVAIAAVQDNRIIATHSFGCCADSVPVLADGWSSELFGSVAAMQLIERQKLRPTDAVPGETAITVEQVLTHQADPSLLVPIIEASSGARFADYVRESVLAPLSPGGDNGLLKTVGSLLVALLNGGEIEGRKLLQPDTARVMLETHFMLHPALPGWAYGFAEMRRNGWRALQWDGLWSATPEKEARIVLIPEAKLAYFIVVDGRADSSFWRTLDEGLFDRLMPPRDAPEIGVTQTAAPPAQDAHEVAGLYEPDTSPLASAAVLKTKDRVLSVRAGENGSLVLAGGENATLGPRPGGYWAAEGGNLAAIATGGRLVLSSGMYRPLRLWKRPALYGSLALLLGLAAIGASYGERRARRTPAGYGRVAAVGLAATASLLLAAALVAWHALPSV
jgi:hypothetical protein